MINPWKKVIRRPDRGRYEKNINNSYTSDTVSILQEKREAFRNSKEGTGKDIR